ncbi:MAG: DMT family transporter [Bdellovibrionales bacterium]|nr:DMT family transporter [Ramlibacter sp.]
MQALWMVLASFIFATMGVCVKIASDSFNSAELVFWRGVIGMVFMWGLARSRGVSLATPVFGMHVWRSSIGVLSLGAWFYAIAHLPLATAMTLNYMSSVWIAAFLVGGALMAWNPTKPGTGPLAQGPLVLTVLGGFAGVLMILQPTVEQDQAFAGIVGLLSGIGAAFAYMQVMALARAGEPETRTVFYFAAGTVVAGALGMLVAGVSPFLWKQALWMLPIGVLASLGQLCMTRAYSNAATLVVANLQYSGIVFAAVYGVLLFGDLMSPMIWAGMGLVIASGIAATVLRERAAPDSPAEEH